MPAERPAERESDEAKGSLAELTREECHAYLTGCVVGRVAVCPAGEAPLVVPVNYVVAGDDIVFRSDPGMKIDAMRDAPASFQIDSIDPFHRTGWSVLVRGRVEELREEDAQGLEVVPWVAGEKRLWRRLVATSITGRRIDLPEIEVDTRGYL